MSFCEKMFEERFNDDNALDMVWDWYGYEQGKCEIIAAGFWNDDSIWIVRDSQDYMYPYDYYIIDMEDISNYPDFDSYDEAVSGPDSGAENIDEIVEFLQLKY